MRKLRIWILLCLILTAACAPAGGPIPTQTPLFTEEADLPTRPATPVSKKAGDIKSTPTAGVETISPAKTPQPPRLPPDQAAFRPLDANPIPAACQKDLVSAREAEINHLTILNLGSCMAGVLNPEGAGSHLSQAYFLAGEQVTIVMTLDALPDDSIRAKEIRIDLAYRQGSWQVVWSGARWICQAGRGQQDWGVEYCL